MKEILGKEERYVYRRYIITFIYLFGFWSSFEKLMFEQKLIIEIESSSNCMHMSWVWSSGTWARAILFKHSMQFHSFFALICWKYWLFYESVQKLEIFMIKNLKLDLHIKIKTLVRPKSTESRHCYQNSKFKESCEIRAND